MNRTEAERAYVELMAECRIYSPLLYGIGVATIVFCPLLIFCVVKRTPKEMRLFRCIFLNITISSTILSMIITLAQPVHVPPLAGGFAYGIMGQWAPNAYCLMVSIAHATVGNMMFVYLAGFIHHFHLMAPMAQSKYQLLWRFSAWLETGQNVYRFFGLVGLYSIVYASVFGFLLAHMSLVEPNDPTLDPLNRLVFERQPSAVVMRTDTRVMRIWIGSLVTLVIGCSYVLIILINALILRAIGATKSMVSAATVRRQLMVYRVLLVNTVGLTVFFFVPTIFILKDFIRGVGNPHFSLWLFAAVDSLAAGQSVVTLLTVRPYRDWLFRCIRLRMSEVESSENKSQQTS